MANEQLEVRISGRDFGISLKGYNPQANAQIRAQLAGETDLLVLLRAYLDVVHQKCELESRLAQLNEKLDSMLKSQRYSLRESPQILQDLQDLPKEFAESGSTESIDSGAESTKERTPESTESTALESAAPDSRALESVKDSAKAPAPKHAQVPQVPLARLDSLDSAPADSPADFPADSPAQANPVALDLFSALESHAESAL